MLGAYASFLLILGASLVVGQGVFAACGRREWSWLAPAVGLGVITAVDWGIVRLPGEGASALAALALLVLASLTLLPGRTGGLPNAVRIGLPVAVAALLAASLPFFVEGRFGILGTGLNPDMSQHLFAADQLAHGEEGRLLSQGYPLGPHSLVVATTKGTGASLVHAFDGLVLATAVIAALTALALFARIPGWRRVAGALLVGLPYMVASSLIQGAFKETMEALFLLAFSVGLHELTRARLTSEVRLGVRRTSRPALVAIPLVALAAGSVYSYSFPGLLWLAGAAGVWALVELVLIARRESPAAAVALARRAGPATAVAVAALALVVAPEVGRMVEFASFETFDPSGAGLGNLFNSISPFEALGIWPSGDFRLEPGAGAMPAGGFYLGGVLAVVALAYGLAWWLRRGEWAVPAALAFGAAVFAYAHFAGTPYQAAKAIAIASPLAMLIAARAVLSPEPLVALGGLRGAIARRRGGVTGILARYQRPLGLGLGVAFLGAAAGSTALALVNGPVGPTTYSPELTKLRPALGADSTLVLAPEHLLADQHGRDYLVWELRGGRVCVDQMGAPSSSPPPYGAAHVITQGSGETPPFTELELERRAGPYELWRRQPVPRGHGSCPLISPGGRANPAGD